MASFQVHLLKPLNHFRSLKTSVKRDFDFDKLFGNILPFRKLFYEYVM